MKPAMALFALITLMAMPTFAALPAAADAPFAPPTPLLDPTTAKPGPKAVAQAFKLNGIKGTLEKTTFAEVQKRFGGEVTRQGEAGNALSWLCYDLPAQHLRVWLTSDELHTHRQISGITIWSVPSAAQSPNCPVATGPQSAELDGISLGQDVGAVLARLGAPGLVKGDWSAYLHMAKDGKLDERDYLVVKTDNSHVSHLQAGRLTTN